MRWLSWFLAGAVVGVALSSFCATLFNDDSKYMAPNLMTLFPVIPLKVITT